MNEEQIAVLWAVAMLVAWSGVCWSAGALWDATRRATKTKKKEPPQ